MPKAPLHCSHLSDPVNTQAMTDEHKAEAPASLGKRLNRNFGMISLLRDNGLVSKFYSCRDGEGKAGLSECTASICLLANEQNQTARSLYEGSGYRQASNYCAIYVSGRGANAKFIREACAGSFLSQLH
jgi:hypothetical protein